MNALYNNAIARVLIAITALVLVLAAVGCDRLTGEKTPNRAPDVYFVNVPPDGHQTSFDPVVYWVGTDIDGTISMYRYIVVREDEMGGTTDPAVYAQTVLPNRPESDWTYLDVPPEDPQTTNIIPMSANLNDPISSYVGQYVFLQAFDDMGAHSPIIWKLFLRNDNPPNTNISITDQVYINAAEPAGAITGVRFSISSEDPDEADSLFEFQWKVFGPYTFDDESDTAQWQRLADLYFKRALVTTDARVFISGYGLADTIIQVVVTPGGIDTVESVILIDTAVVSSNLDPFYGRVETTLDMEAFVQDGELFKPVDSSYRNGSPWVSNNKADTYADSLYNLFRNESNTVTLQRYFLLWAQARDAASVVDGTPRYRGFEVVDPKYERDILVIDFMSFLSRINAPVFAAAQGIDTARDYWAEKIATWANTYYPGEVDFIPSRDIIRTEAQLNELPLGQLLGYKVLILYNDYLPAAGMADASGVGSTPQALNIFTAIDAGVNVWATWRSPVYGGITNTPSFAVRVPPEFVTYFGVQQLAYSGWGFYARGNAGPKVRIEDFVGAISLKKGEGWPDLTIDTANLHRRYDWPIRQSGQTIDSSFVWEPPLGLKFDLDNYSYPEVNWALRTYGTDIIYLYKSFFSPNLHPLGQELTFDGAPVGIRYETDLFRTAFFCFTPLPMEDDVMQTVIDSVMNWLYDPQLAVPTTGTRYHGSDVTIGADRAREAFFERGLREEQHRRQTNKTVRIER
ncbi:MAG: hypothetical protein RBT76_04875 [candidate division Zixibacteria bacterium]|jgi:hypothetical protein|nr:hypothetical protein [candidate division Zixibacteria bacterium]